ncbi:MAG TPA: GIY-YIG nuclease family protein [Caulobacteraceae bacterium]
MAEEHIYAVYIMTNVQRGVLYTGVTGDLLTRAQQHRDGEVPGFTRTRGCKTLVWFELHGDISQAIAREKLIKRWRRGWKFDLIEALNPGWQDLWPGLVGSEPYPWEAMIGDTGAGAAKDLWSSEGRPRG